MTIQVITFPGAQVSDIPACLRDLAENIEAGNFGEAIALLWVLDCGDGQVEVGLSGRAGEPAPTAHFLAGAAQKRLLSGIAE